eukprot:g4894.t1
MVVLGLRSPLPRLTDGMKSRHKTTRFEFRHLTHCLSSNEDSNGIPESQIPLPRVESEALPQNFCLIESRHAVKDFADLQVNELQAQVESRRSRIFLLLEEIRRLRLQVHLKSTRPQSQDESLQEMEYSSIVPMLNRSHFLQEKNMKRYIAIYIWMVTAVILFGGLIAPSLEVKMGLGGTSYLDFIQSIHLPEQLAEVDPIVASFCGGAVGALSTLLVIDLQNVRNQRRNRCYYCKGVGYLPCGSCVGSGIDNAITCATCSGTGKVMCPNCFCTGKHLVTEHDPRFDPFD